ncbi:MAG: glycosyltransferase family 2 protein [Deltaproteobacteria bacterium]|nr:MAG: glycosyltransferase family 2 protein [Deltaproteobacteria bacterium]
MISIIIPAYNSEKTIEKLLISLRESTFSKYEVIVVNDHSTDNTNEIARKYSDTLINLDKRSGPAYARNIGAEKANGDILLFLDADVFVDPGLLEYVHKRFQENPEMKALVGIYSKEPANDGFFPRYKALMAYSWFQGVKFIYSFDSHIAAIKKEVFVELGGYNTFYKDALVEDFEFGYRISEKYPIYLDTKLQVAHHFPSFIDNARKYFQRCFFWIKLFLHRRKFDKAGGTPREGISRFSGFASFFSMLLIPFCPLVGMITFLLLFFLYFSFSIKFFSFCLREEGTIFTIRAIGTHYLNSIIIGTSALLALVSSIFPFFSLINRNKII